MVKRAAIIVASVFLAACTPAVVHKEDISVNQVDEREVRLHSLRSSYQIHANEVNGTAVAVDPYLVVTAGHVLAGMNDGDIVKLTAVGDDETFLEGYVFRLLRPQDVGDPDLAVVRMHKPLKNYVALAPKPPKLLEEIFVSGYLFGGGPVSTNGLWLGVLPRTKVPIPAVRAVAYKGMSGGGVFNSRGELLSIVTNLVPYPIDTIMGPGTARGVLSEIGWGQPWALINEIVSPFIGVFDYDIE